MGVRRGVAPGEREADAAWSGLVIADVGVGDPVGIGKNEELVPEELGIVNRRAAALQLVAQRLERQAQGELGIVIVGQRDAQRSIEKREAGCRQFLRQRQTDRDPDLAVGHRMPDDLKPPRIEVRTGDRHQAIHLLRGKDAERREAVVDLEFQDRVEQAGVEIGVGNGRPVARRRQKHLQFDTLIERQPHEGVFRLGIARELGLSGCFNSGTQERAGDEPQQREERRARAGSAGWASISHFIAPHGHWPCSLGGPYRRPRAMSSCRPAFA